MSDSKGEGSMQIREAQLNEVDAIVSLHLRAFPGFFLSFMGPGFLKCLYRAFIEHEPSALLVALDGNGSLSGFVAFSNDLSGLYRFLLKRDWFKLGFYSFLAVLRRPSSFMRLFRALKQPGKSERKEKYAELSSLAVAPECERQGIGQALVKAVQDRVDFERCAYLKLETDAQNNEGVNAFYQRNGFQLDHSYKTPEGRLMNEYRYRPFQTEEAQG